MAMAVREKVGMPTLLDVSSRFHAVFYHVRTHVTHFQCVIELMGIAAA
jgi:hypothetical protein